MTQFHQVFTWIIPVFMGLGCYPGVAQTTAAKVETSAVENSGTPSPLIQAEQLKQILDSAPDSVRILEASTDVKKYDRGHIPRAIFVHWLDDMTGSENPEFFSNLTSEELAALMSRKGISNRDRIVIYDRLSSRLSTRLYWTLKSYGVEQVQILDGGFKAWQSKYKLSKETPRYPATEFRVPAARPELTAGSDFVKNHLDDPKATFIDGRPKKQYTGEEPGKVYHTGKIHAKRGHIPGAVNIFWKENFNADGTFKSAQELKELYADIQPDQRVVTYCNEGLHAAPPWFVLTEILGFPDVRVYDNSMVEWANSDNPVEAETNNGK